MEKCSKVNLFVRYFDWSARSLTQWIGEHESLTAIHSAVPSLCPKSIAHGKLSDSLDYFLLTEFIDMEAGGGGQNSGLSLAQKLAKLHSSPAPFLKGYPDQPLASLS